MNVLKSLGEYVNDVLDKDKDGVVSFKEFMAIFPSSAIAIALLVVDVLVLVAEYRVWDFAMYLTKDPIKAAGFVLVSGFPFYLAQVLWLYPRATWIQQMVALAIGCTSLYTSAVYGLADLSRDYDAKEIFTFIVELSAMYTIVLLVYVLNDKGVKAWRMKVKARAAADEAGEMNAITRAVLEDLKKSLEQEKLLEAEFGRDAVQAQLNRLRGNKGKKDNQPAPQVQNTAYAANTRREELQDKNPTSGG